MESDDEKWLELDAFQTIEFRILPVPPLIEEARTTFRIELPPEGEEQ